MNIIKVIKRDGTEESFNKDKLNIALNKVLISYDPNTYLEDASLVYKISDKIKKNVSSRSIISSSEIQEMIEVLLLKYTPLAHKYYVISHNEHLQNYVIKNCISESNLFLFKNKIPDNGINESLNIKLNKKNKIQWLQECLDYININNTSFHIDESEKINLLKYLYNGFISLSKIKYHNYIVNLDQLYETSGRFNKELLMSISKILARFIVRQIRLEKTLESWNNNINVYVQINGIPEMIKLLEMTEEEYKYIKGQFVDIFNTELNVYANHLNLYGIKFILKE